MVVFLIFFIVSFAVQKLLSLIRSHLFIFVFISITLGGGSKRILLWKSFIVSDLITSHQSEWPSSKNLQIINAGEDVEKREPSYTVGENVNWYSHYGEQYGDSLKKLGINLPYDPAIPLLGVYPEKATILKDTCTPLFIVALFTVDRTWKQPRCPSKEEGIKKMWYIFTMDYYSAIKINDFESVLVRCMKLDPIKLNEVSQKEKKILYITTYTWNLEKWYWWTYVLGSNGDAYVENGLIDIVGWMEKIS